MDQKVPLVSSSDKLERNAVAGTSSSIYPENTEPMEEKYKWWRYIPLLKATLRGDWKTAENFFQQDKSALTAPIVGETLDTTLHIAVGSRRGEEDIHFVEKLVDLMPVEALATKNSGGYTPLHIAAWVGNTKAAKILVDKHPPLLYTISGFDDLLPIHLAALHARRDTLSYLLDVTDDDVTDDQVFNGQSGAAFINCLISSDFFDIALKWVERYPRLAILQHKRSHSPLEFITWMISPFPSERSRNCFRRGSHLGFWLRKIYPHVPVKLEKCSVKDQNNRDEVEINIQGTSHARGDNRAQSIGKNISIFGDTVSQNLHAILWKVLEFSVPQIKHIQEEKLIHVQALQLVKTLCEKITLLKDVDAYNRVVYQAMNQAIETGIPEIIQEIADWFPGSIWIQDSRNRNLFQRAIADRDEGVFNLIYQMGGHRCFATINLDNKENTILHLAGCLGPAYRLSLVPGAALQMQRELQWFEEVKKFVHPGVMEYRNTDRETPEMVFTREHKDLVAKGEEWMKGTANSCTITAALIVTVVFAAAITIPGGNNGDTGLPIFSQEVAFTVFAVSDAISLFTSATSLLMFLSILTSRYEQGDFLYVLPKRLIIGLFTLFLSITTMMVAFSCTLYLVFGRKTAWILIPVAVLTCLPITSFVTLQFPLLVTLISSTYGKGIFGKQSNRPFY